MRARKLTSKPEEVQRKSLKGLKLTEWDRKNIAYTIAFFERAFPGVIKAVTDQARRETEPITRRKTIKDDLNFTRRMAIPDGLWGALKEQYPALLVDKRQFEQFLKWFPQFDVKR